MLTKYKAISKLFIIVMIMISMIGITPIYANSSSSLLLADVSFSEGYLSKYEFTPSRTWYQLTVPTGTDNIEVTAIPKDPTAEIDIGGHRNMVKTKSKKIVITVKQGSNTKYYTFELVFSDKAVTTTATTTTTKATTTTTTTTTSSTTTSQSEITSGSSSSEAEVTTSSNTTTTVDQTSSKLSYLGVKGEKFTKSFASNTYEYVMTVNDKYKDFEIETIKVSPNAEVNTTRYDDRYVVEVTNGSNKTTYIIKLNVKNTTVDENVKQAEFTVIRNGIIGIVLLILAVLLFILSRRLSEE
ncbi:MAG: cadherin-like beta sandwich domain-containing protein [Erysipelotrichales bacterium]|nr:cadherin-like beta sandwich domain-containing protein [Erysipelotrichales bacterium]